MSIFGSFADFLQGPVGNNLKNNPQDVRSTKRNLHQAGFFNDEVENDFITRALDQGIRAYQRENDLKQDGVLLPIGETELSLFRALSNRNTSAEPSQDSTPLTQTQKEFRLAEVIIGNNKQGPQEQIAIPEMTRQLFWSQNLPPAPHRKPETIASTPKGNKILDLIGTLESSDNYNVIFGGEERPLTKMTIKEVFELQEQLLAEGKKSSAVGRYQFIRNTLKEEVSKMGIDENTIFDENLQDQLARSRLIYRGFEKFKAGTISTEEFIENLAREWAAFPKDPSNQSHHKGVLNNKALTDFQTLKKTLEND